MTQGLLIVVGVLVAALAAALAGVRVEGRRRREAEAVLSAVVGTNHALMGQIEKLHGELEARGEIQREADGRVSDLHSGDSVANAIRGLSER